MNELIKTKRYKSGEEFLEDISFGGGMYKILKNGFVYRGHQSGTYELVPSVLRNKVQLRDASGNVVDEDDVAPFDFANSEFIQKNLEYLALRQFFDLCDKSGLRLPSVDKIRQSLFSHQDILSSFLVEGEWLPYDLQELAALAQHYGMETRLLDWTMSLDIAIYFAVNKEPILTEKEQSQADAQYVAVWALNQMAFFMMDTPLRIIRPPYYGNPNLAAQQGLFTFWMISGLQMDLGNGTNKDNMEIFRRLTNRTPLDVLIAEEFEKLDRKDVIMWKLLVPRKDRKVLYEYIRNRNISAASLFPGYGGVVRALKEDKEIGL